MEKRTEIVEILNDLVQINNDRIEGYKKAVAELDREDADLKSLFDKMIIQSMTLKSDLAEEIQTLHGEMDKGTTASGKIYRAWMSVKAVFTGHDRHHILENCEFGEDAAQNAYKTALESDVIPDFIRDILQHQKTVLHDSHDQIKSLRDVHA